MNTFFQDTFATAFGKFSVAVDESGAIVATAFGDSTALASRLRLCRLVPDRAKVAAARQQVSAYLAGDRVTFDLPLAAEGTSFQQRVWSALCEIPFGETRSYGQIAAQLGSPFAARAVGRANATNPICLIVPCHRVIGVSGALTGFAFGEDIKRRLLELERSRRSRAA